MWYLFALNVTILVAVSAFSVSAMSHIAMSWLMRKDFEIAMRCVLQPMRVYDLDADKLVKYDTTRDWLPSTPVTMVRTRCWKLRAPSFTFPNTTRFAVFLAVSFFEQVPWPGGFVGMRRHLRFPVHGVSVHPRIRG